MGDFGYNYSKSRSPNERRHDPVSNKKFNRHQDNNAIVNHVVDEIILQEVLISGVEYKTHDDINYEVN